MKAARYFSTLALVLVLWAGTSGASLAAVVTLDFAAKSGQSDTKTLNPLSVRVQGGQIGAYVESTSPESQSFVLKVNGLTDTSYDIYINSTYSGEKSLSDLTQGIQLTVPGAIGDPAMMRCLQALKSKVDAEYARQQKGLDAEQKRVTFTLGQACDWVRLGINSEKAYRSLDIIIAPAGRPIKAMIWRTRLNAEETAGAITRACWLLQQARSRMYKFIKNPDIRNSAVSAMTPVDLTVTYDAVKKNKPHVELRVVNNCNLPISGSISFALAKGWKSNAKGLSFTELKAGKTFAISFDLIPPAKGSVPLTDLTAAANIKIVQDMFEAKVKLKTTTRPCIM